MCGGGHVHRAVGTLLHSSIFMCLDLSQVRRPDIYMVHGGKTIRLGATAAICRLSSQSVYRNLPEVRVGDAGTWTLTGSPPELLYVAICSVSHCSRGSLRVALWSFILYQNCPVHLRSCETLGEALRRRARKKRFSLTVHVYGISVSLSLSLCLCPPSAVETTL